MITDITGQFIPAAAVAEHIIYNGEISLVNSFIVSQLCKIQFIVFKTE
jgi:hypothetical protein